MPDKELIDLFINANLAFFNMYEIRWHMGHGTTYVFNKIYERTKYSRRVFCESSISKFTTQPLRRF